MTLALTYRPMRVLTPVGELMALAVLHAREELALRSTGAFEFVGG
jgi:hypothetical protein